ncbi:hypothetical protein CRE_11617 [Caenorhabditis remanei]|uniref:Uncharacterized protein n=1 Tax=Caenorhabditis remanei TaxID=31234 RepID=E3NTV7_CAERE|nr:hypothetical protein CRE_11617 [Caenorhabditis remanei]
MLANGGIITIDDLRNYETHVTETLYADLGKYRMCGPPPPSSWTITQAIPRIVEIPLLDKQFLNNCIMPTNLSVQYRDKKMFNDAEFYHTLIEAQKLAYGQRGHLGDYLFSEVSMQLAKNLTDRKFIQFLSKRVMAQSQDLEYYLAAAPAVLDSGTSQISVVDDDGNAVSLTSSINTAFGSKMLSKYGFIYNNQMDDFSTPGFRNN